MCRNSKGHSDNLMVIMKVEVQFLVIVIRIVIVRFTVIVTVICI